MPSSCQGDMTGLYREQKSLFLSLLFLSLLPVCPAVFGLDQYHVNTGAELEQHWHLVVILRKTSLQCRVGRLATKLCCIFHMLLSVSLYISLCCVFHKLINVFAAHLYFMAHGCYRVNKAQPCGCLKKQYTSLILISPNILHIGGILIILMSNHQKIPTQNRIVFSNLTRHDAHTLSHQNFAMHQC